MRFRLASLLMFITFLAVAGGLGLQIHLLRQQVSALSKQVQTLQQRPMVFPGAQRVNSYGSVFRLLDTERGMKADEIEFQQRMRDRLNPQPIPERQRPPKDLGIDWQ
jgi:hypothetical protein